MAILRGLKALLKSTSPGKLVRAKQYTCFRATSATGRPIGPKLRGVARRLGEVVFSSGELPVQTQTRFKGKAWRGVDGGLRRGKAVDSQVSRLAKGSAAARKGATMLKLTRHCFAALDHHGLKPVEAQRVVLDAQRGVATAVDVLCQRADDELVLVELKCGYRGNRASPVRHNGRVVKMSAPLKTATDCALHRHLAQLAATHALFLREMGTMKALEKKGIANVTGALLYVDDDASELHALPDWWKRRAQRLLDSIS
tara:strand:+ start:898 stop:1665 length:768 start_codon:yes stop_codon:yes gene_type:complete